MNAVPKSTSTAKFSSTERRTLVSKSPMLICSVMLSFVLRRSFDVYKSDGRTSLDTLHDQSVGRKCFEIRFRWAPVSKNQATGRIILYSAQVEMRTIDADFFVTAVTEI